MPSARSSSSRVVSSATAYAAVLRERELLVRRGAHLDVVGVERARVEPSASARS